MLHMFWSDPERGNISSGQKVCLVGSKKDIFLLQKSNGTSNEESEGKSEGKEREVFFPRKYINFIYISLMSQVMYPHN